MANNNTWVGYIQRGYQEIKSTLLNRLSVNVPEVTDRSESNIFVILISMWAALIEQLNYYIDMIARENFITTAKLYSSLQKHAKLYQYRIRLSLPSRAELVLTLVDSATTDPVPAPYNILIPQGSVINNGNNISYITDADYIILEGDSMILALCTQHTQVLNTSMGITTGVANEIISINPAIEDLTISLSINGNTYDFVDNFSQSLPTDKHFSTYVDKDKVPYLLFGDGLNGVIVESGTIMGNYFVTLNEGGIVLNDTLTSINMSGITIPGGSTLNVTNPLKSYGGVPIENTEMLKKNLPLSLRTLNRAVTLNNVYNDFADVAILSPGIFEAAAETGECGYLINIYVVPYNGGLASQAQRDITKTYVEDRAVIGTTIKIHPAGEANLVLFADVTGKPNYTESKIENDITNILEYSYNWRNKKLGDSVHLSDIIALIDNLTVVDYMTLTNFYIIPFPNPIDDTDVLLDWDMVISDGDESILWTLKLPSTSNTEYQLLKDGIPQAFIDTGVEYSNTYFYLTINTTGSAGHVDYQWDFRISSMNSDVDLTDYSLPVFDASNIHLNITES